MTAGVLLVSHEGIAQAMLDTATRVWGKLPLPTAVLQIEFDVNLQQATERAQKMISELDSGAGVLILVDIKGATPSNILNSVEGDIRLVTGLNLPMLFRIYNYADKNIDQLLELAIEGGQKGIMQHRKQAT
ncbi:MAG: PTS fructose transporter subunit IIA [Chromatiales bacterium]|jgi:PTS system ascorbate-specific IIA component